MKLKTVSGGTIEVSDQAFNRDYKEALVHQVVTAYLAGARQGTRAQKTRSEVSGGGRKPWRQKGTGRARAGTIRSPIWRSGGVTFAAKPQNHKQKVNKKMYRAAMQSILSELVRQGRLLIIKELEVSEPKTKMLADKLIDLQLGNVLIVLDKVTTPARLSARNLRHVDLCEVHAIDPVSLVSFEKVLVTIDALRAIEELLA